MKKKLVVILSTLFLLLLYIMPFPIKHRLEAVAYMYHSDTENASYALSLDWWTLNYLFRTDKYRGHISLSSPNNVVFDNVDFSASSYLVGPLETLGDVNWFNFMSYDADVNAYVSTNVYISNEDLIMIERDDIVYIAPAESFEEADSILTYFESYMPKDNPTNEVPRVASNSSFTNEALLDTPSMLDTTETA